uniref:Uncharacterized protein MANES_06G142400 n=1 Tax=Rhizophora mucronata TaxID=61149 RepID=A0A2P2LWV5_RHIMU
MLAAHAFGAPRIVIVDVDDYRLSVAKDLGADQIVKVSTNIEVCLYVLEKSFSSMQQIYSPLIIMVFPS